MAFSVFFVAGFVAGDPMSCGLCYVVRVQKGKRAFEIEGGACGAIFFSLSC